MRTSTLATLALLWSAWDEQVLAQLYRDEDVVKLFADPCDGTLSEVMKQDCDPSALASLPTLPRSCLGTWPCGEEACFASPEYDALKRDLKRVQSERIVTINLRGWGSSELQAHLAAILLHELAGYKVQLRPTRSANGMIPLISKGDLTFDFEAWTSPGREELIEYGMKEGLMLKSETGILGDEGLFFSSYTTKSDGSPVRGTVAEFKSHDVLSQFPRDGSVPKEMLLRDQNDESEGFVCGPDWSWSPTEPTTCTSTGKFYPPQCLPLDPVTGLSPYCAEVCMVNPSYVRGWFEATVINLGLNFSFSYLREDAAVPFVLQKLRNEEPVIFFRWYPDIMVIELKDRVELLQFPPMQFDHSAKALHFQNPDPLVSEVAHAYPAIIISKYANMEALKDETLSYFFKRYVMTKKWMDDLVLHGYSDNQTLGAYGGACKFARNHTNELAEWIRIKNDSNMLSNEAVVAIAIAAVLVAACLGYAAHEVHTSRKKVNAVQQRLKVLSHKVNKVRHALRQSLSVDCELTRKVQAMIIDPERCEYDPDNSESVIGKGASGMVVKGRYNKQLVAFKILLHCHDDNLDKFKHEAVLHHEIVHENVLQIHGIVVDGVHPAIVMEFAVHGTLRSCLKSKAMALTWNEPKKRWGECIAKAMGFMHTHSYFSETELAYVGGVIHRDLKTDNILINEMYNPKISDFGESRRNTFDGDMTTVGTADFAAPEIVAGAKYDEKVDVYSFGIILAEMVRHDKPYAGLPRAGLTLKIANGLRPAIPDSFKEEWPDIDSLMQQCWDVDPKKRPSMVDAANSLFRALPSSAERKRRASFSKAVFTSDLHAETLRKKYQQCESSEVAKRV